MLRNIALALLSLIVSFMAAPSVQAFCGFFVAKADAKLYNSASQVVIAREGERSVFLMSNNFEGDVKDFARIVPVPVIPRRDQIRIGDRATVEQIDAFTSPRLAVYEDDPCREEYGNYLLWGGAIGIILVLGNYIRRGNTLISRISRAFLIAFIIGILMSISVPSFLNQSNKARGYRSEKSLGIRVEDSFTLGEYDVIMLTAKESNGLRNWLVGNSYVVPEAANAMFQSYIDSGMKFFVIRVNLQEYKKQKAKFLRPVVLEYESPEFMLPIRLGTLNAKSDQDLTINIISPDGFVEVSNYANVTIPTDAISGKKSVSGQELPRFIQNNFGEFYKAVFQKAYENSDQKSIFLEYAGSTSKCDPCSVPPLTDQILEQVGIRWFGDIHITRLHVRYNQANFAEDLSFRFVESKSLSSKLQEENKFFYNIRGFQGRYVTRSLKNPLCFSALEYLFNGGHEMANLQRLTGWNIDRIHQTFDKKG